MNNDAGLPAFVLEAGPWKAEVFDPRAMPSALGMRYCNGGYVRALWHADRLLTGRARPGWSPVDGEGLPEEFEVCLGATNALEGEEYLRIGSGRYRKQGRGVAPETLPAAWQVVSSDERHVRMQCRDRVVTGGTEFEYELIRDVRLSEEGLASSSTLRMQMPWAHPMGWYAHPFFLHGAANCTGFELPGQPEVQCLGPHSSRGWGLTDTPTMRRDEHGVHYFTDATESLASVTNLWGERGPVVLHLDPALGGGRLALQLDRPLDHLVLYASDQVASPEMKISRCWREGEKSNWTLRYSWPGD
ncbi:MAG: hypothetical protein WCI03_14360 [bacterium]|jgi:hypothetical protein